MGLNVSDVVIVGGGPAGSSCARRLRAAGLDVLVLDRARFPRDKPCAGWITPALVQTLRLPLEEYARRHELQPITAFITGRLGGPEIETRYQAPVSYGIRRCELDHYLLRRSGARVQAGVAATSLRRAGSRWVVNDAFAAPVLVGAGGHFCPVSRLLNPDTRPDGVVVTQEVEFRMDARQRACTSVAPERPELLFCRDLDGYGWCFRKGDYLNVGLGRRDHQGLARHAQDFASYVVARGKAPADMPTRWRGHAYRLYGPQPWRRVDDGLVLVGDAAGLADAASGEGIRPAVESGLLAAEAILAAGGDYRRERLASYEDALVARLGRPRTPLPLPPGLVRILGARLLATRAFARRVLLDRWFLHAGQGALPGVEPAEEMRATAAISG